MSAVVHVNLAIRTGDIDVVIADGIGSSGPWVLSKASKAFGKGDYERMVSKLS